MLSRTIYPIKPSFDYNIFMRTVRVGIDIGGTFTDFVLFDSNSQQITTFKVLSTPQDPGQAVLNGLRQAGLLPPPPETRLEIMHGSTVATNALLERKGAAMALITTRGFKDILQIGRQNRPELYNLNFHLPAPLVPLELRFEIDERVSAEGVVLKPVDQAELDFLVNQVAESGVQSVALCLLFSFLKPQHEQQIAAALRRKGLFVSASCEILPEYREYERMSTTAVNAYVSPVLDRYLGNLAQTLCKEAGSAFKLQIMQSNGGVITVDEARRSGVHCILSGPAGGVVGAQLVGETVSARQPLKILTFDMGGTSTDVALIDGLPRLTSESLISGIPVRIPVLEIHTIGAGGGSIAAADLGGALRVGPESAGAVPGPACYSQSEPGSGPIPDATVTDANLILGRLGEPYFLNGAMPLNQNRAKWAITELSAQLKLEFIETALGIVEVANAHMERALRVISVERGRDPRDFILLSFGGAGGLHAADLARGLGIPRVLFPPTASVLSALGMVAASTIKDYSQTVMLPGNTDPSVLKEKLKPLIAQAINQLQEEGLDSDLIHLDHSLDIRYQGQSYELAIPWPNGSSSFLQVFHTTHKATYGYANPFSAVEIVNLRLRASGPKPALQLPTVLPRSAGNPSAGPEIYKYQQVYLRSQNGTPTAVTAACYHWEALRSGDIINGPALIVRSDTTILLAPGDQAFVDIYLNLIVEISGNVPPDLV